MNLNVDVASGRLGATGVGAKEPGAADGRFLLEVGGDKIECIRVHGGKVVKFEWNYGGILATIVIFSVFLGRN